MIARLLRLFRREDDSPDVPLLLAGVERSSKWPAVRAAHLKLFPRCDVCGTRDGVEVHHLIPVFVVPSLELASENLQTLCRPHHWLVGHLCSWHSWNRDALSDARTWRAKINSRPKHSP